MSEEGLASSHMPSKRRAEDDDDESDLDEELEGGSPQGKRKKYQVWAPDMVHTLINAYTLAVQKKEIAGSMARLSAKGWRTVELELRKHYADIDVHACKSKFKALRKGFEAIQWCELHQEKAAAEGLGRFRGETYSEFFDRLTTKPKGWKVQCKVAMQSEPFIDIIRPLLSAIEAEAEQNRRMAEQQQQQQQQHQHLGGGLNVSLLDNVVEERMQLTHSHNQVDDRRTNAVTLETLNPRNVVGMTSIGMATPAPRLSDHSRRNTSSDRRSDELITVFREFNEIMREGNNTIKTLLTRLIEMCPE